MTNKKINAKNHKFLKTISLYSLIFLILSLVIVYIFFKYNRLFIWNSSDGVKQHIVTLRYFRELVLDFIKTGNFNTFTWKIASGIDMYGNLVYYIIGDFLSYLAIFFKVENLNKLYSVLVLIRMYLVGISFLRYTNYKKMKTVPSLLGALYYTFSTFMLFSAVRHPYFTNALILFPLVLMGFEKLITENKKIFYTFIICLTFISNFYFAYMIFLNIAIYGVIFIFYHYKKESLKKKVQTFLNVVICSLIGLLLSGFIVLPAIFSFLESERTGALAIAPYTLSYYRNLVKGIFSLESPGFWVYNGIGQSIVLLSLPVFFNRRKENIPLFVTLLILTLPLISSKIASIFCGFSFPNNRWTFILSFILSYSIVLLFNNNASITKKELVSVGIFIAFFLLYNIVFDQTLDKYLLIQFLILLGWICIMYLKNFPKVYKADSFIKIGLCVLSIIISIIFFYDTEGLNYSKEFLKQGELKKYVDTSYKTIEDFSKAIHYIKKDNTFYKISKYPYNYENVSLMKDYNAIGHFYSITPKVYSDLNFDLANLDYRVSMGLGEFNYRSKITTLLGEKYFINGSADNKRLYGYVKDNEYEGSSSIYENKYSLPFGVLYTSYITEEEYNKLNPLEKESSLLKQTVYNNKMDISNLKEGNNIFNIQELNYKVEDSSKMIDNNKINVEKENNHLTLSIPNTKNSELYIYFTNLEYHSLNKEEIIKKELEGITDRNKIEQIKKNYKWYEPSYGYNLIVSYNDFVEKKKINDYKTSPYYVNTKDFLFNLGYLEKHSGNIEITFSEEGFYTYDEIKVYAVNFDDYEEDINNLKRSNFNVKNYSNSILEGEINASSNGILQFQTLYTKGMHVYVDGKKVDTFKSNKYFLGINIARGEHKIVLKYKNPYLFYGGILSCIGLFMLIITLRLEHKKKK